MATPHQVQLGNLLYTVVDDCTTTYWAIITGAVTDEILGDLYAPEFTVDTGRPDLLSKTMPNGLFAVTGYPEQSFPTPGTVNLVLRAPGFRDFKISVAIPVNAIFPLPAGTMQLRRLPVRIQGRVVNDVTRAPIPGVQVLSVDNPLTPPTVHTTALRTPLYFDHVSGTPAQLTTITPTGTATLNADVAARSQILVLSTRMGLGPGSIVKLSNASQTVAEYGVVDHLGPGAPASAGDVFLRNSLNHSYSQAPAATTVQFVTATLVGPAASLATDANAADGVIVATQLLNGTTLAVDSGALAVEYHEVGALTDSDGYYGLAGMGRVREIFLFAKQGALKQTADWFIEYGQSVNIVDLRLS